MAFFTLLPFARATTVVPPTWAELVGEADAIHRATVTAVSSRRTIAPDGSPIIKTYVTLAIARTLKGESRSELTLELLGGTADGRTLTISSMPHFVVGATDYVFVQRNGVQFCPLVAMRHGRYRVQREAGSGREFIVRDNGTRLTALDQVALPMTSLPPAVLAAAATGVGLTPAAFESAIATELARSPGNLRLN